MKKSVLILMIFLLGAINAFSQAYVHFDKPPEMYLSAKNEYSNFNVKYKAIEKSTIYLELEKGNLIVASGVLDVPRASEKVVTISIKTKALNALPPGNNYSYNLYMYSGGRNDWTKKSCKSVRIHGVKMGNKKTGKKTGMMSLRNFFD